MRLTPTLAAVRFGTGLSPDIPAPLGAEDMLSRLHGPDIAAGAFVQPGWDHKAALALKWVEVRRARNDGTEESEQAYREHTRAMIGEYHSDLGRIIARASRTQDGFRERLHWFWSDHFTVTDGSGLLRKSVAGYYEDAVRPHLSGRFADLLKSAGIHPAMLIYLDQNRSVGPNSPRGKRGAGLNENLAREMLELHTLGVGSTYSQQDVRQLAELLTGLTVTKEGEPFYRAQFVEPGAETVLGRSYGGARPDLGAIHRALEDLSVHPETARHLSTKLAVHFVADTPPADLINAMTVRWLATDGDLSQVYAAMLEHPAAAKPELRKVRRPLEFVAAGMRALGRGAALPNAGNRVIRDTLMNPLQLMGQYWQKAPGPNGWPEEATAWITPQTLAARIEWAMTLAQARADLPDPRDFVHTALAELATPRALFAAQAAESRIAGVGVILSAPEFQRR